VDYVLRGMPVPAGDHTIEWRFEPHSYELGNKVTVWCGILGYLLLITAVVVTWRQSTRKA